MLDKRNTGRMVKIVSLVVAVSFVATLMPTFGLGGGGGDRQTTTSGRNTVQSKPVSDEAKAKDLIGQGRVSEKSGNWDQAVGYYKDATNLDPGNSEGVFLLGRSALQAKQTDLARTSLEKYLSIDPNGAFKEEAKGLLSSL